ncbi:hypothetical protein BC938DRAFT_481888 [Jimgerdemannia flammicorona]|uniref:Uncharacterized protein n=1 Tax=Jimgerdemannia flammicorona TaxID=994334 RepID=A0A433QWX3_9FUNG|nr:hypothetical protein BC938DRAFT_481888 [Jimgerdemannia flammicorona]
MKRKADENISVPTTIRKQRGNYLLSRDRLNPTASTSAAWPNPIQTAAIPEPKDKELNLIRLRVLKLFEDMVYITTASIASHYKHKYRLVFETVGKIRNWLYEILPNHLTITRHFDKGITTTVITLTHRPPLPSHTDPLPAKLLCIRIVRLCPTHIQCDKLLLSLYKYAYGPLCDTQFPLTVRGKNEKEIQIGTWGELVTWARSNINVCEALYAEEEGEAKIGLVNLGYLNWEKPQLQGWTTFVGSRGKVCAQRMLNEVNVDVRTPTEFPMKPNHWKKFWDWEKPLPQDWKTFVRPRENEMSADASTSVAPTELSMRQNYWKGVVILTRHGNDENVDMDLEIPEEVERGTTDKVNSESHTGPDVNVNPKSLTGELNLIPPDLITPAQRRILEVIFVVNNVVPRSRRLMVDL